MRVGEIDVLVVSDGVLTALPAVTLGVNAGPSILSAWLDDMVLPPAFDWPVNVVVVRSGRRSTRSRPGWSCVAPAAIRPGTAWSAWSLAASG
jgi:hypothetical protein